MSEDCFLCAPDPALVVATSTLTYIMVGLGPLTPAYAMIVATRHEPSFADFADIEPDVVKEISRARSGLEKHCGPLLMTEHGRVPLCRDDGDQHDQHCFHAHFLLFATQGRMIEQFGAYYRNSSRFTSLEHALAHARDCDGYMLVSETPEEFAVLSGPLNAPRQLSRTLVAIRSGEDGYADWRSSPRADEARARADHLRHALGGKLDQDR